MTASYPSIMHLGRNLWPVLDGVISNHRSVNIRMTYAAPLTRHSSGYVRLERGGGVLANSMIQSEVDVPSHRYTRLIKRY